MRVEYLLLSDHAVVLDGKLYVHGGGWNETYIRQVPGVIVIGVAASFIVDWNECNIDHEALLECVDMDGHVVWNGTYSFRLGRNANLDFGDDQRMQIAWPMILQVNTVGSYVVTVRVGEQSARVVFKVRQA